MNLEKHMKAIDNLASALGKVRENSKKDKELSRVLAQAAKLERENAKMKQVLGKIYHHVAEEWQDDYYVDSACLFTYLKEAGYESPIGGGEPEPFIHGDTDTGAEG